MKKNKRMTALFIALVLALLPICAQASTTEELKELQDKLQQEKEENKQKQDTLQNNKEEAQGIVNGLENEANALGDTYHQLNTRLQDITTEIANTENAIANTSSDIQSLEEELAQVKEKKKAQYEGMKKRIRFMYENGTDSLLVSVLSSGSIAEFIQRAEYASMIAGYDREMVQAYDELQTTLVAKTEELSQKKEQLSSYRTTLASKQDELDGLVDNAGDAYASKQGEVTAAKMTVEEFNRRIEEYRVQEQALEQQYAAAQAALAQQIAAEDEAAGNTTPEDNSGALAGYTDADLKLMAAIIQAEAGGEPYAGQLAVGTVIMNRVMSAKFPNTLSGVIYQPNQFQPVRNGHLALILEQGPNESCTNAAREVLGGYRSGNWLFFMTQYWADYYGITGYTMIGNHAFFYRWGAN